MLARSANSSCATPFFRRSARTTAPKIVATSGSNDVALLVALAEAGRDVGTRGECQLCYVTGHGIYASGGP